MNEAGTGTPPGPDFPPVASSASVGDVTGKAPLAPVRLLEGGRVFAAVVNRFVLPLTGFARFLSCSRLRLRSLPDSE